MGGLAELLGATIGTVLWGGLISILVEKMVQQDGLTASERATRVVIIAVFACYLLSLFGYGLSGQSLIVLAVMQIPGGILLWLIKRKFYQRAITRQEDTETFS